MSTFVKKDIFLFLHLLSFKFFSASFLATNSLFINSKLPVFEFFSSAWLRMAQQGSIPKYHILNAQKLFHQILWFSIYFSHFSFVYLFPDIYFDLVLIIPNPNKLRQTLSHKLTSACVSSLLNLISLRWGSIGWIYLDFWNWYHNGHLPHSMAPEQNWISPHNFPFLCFFKKMSLILIS